MILLCSNFRVFWSLKFTISHNICRYINFFDLKPGKMYLSTIHIDYHFMCIAICIVLLKLNDIELYWLLHLSSLDICTWHLYCLLCLPSPSALVTLTACYVGHQHLYVSSLLPVMSALSICTYHPYCLLCLLSASVCVILTACYVCSQHLYLSPLLPVRSALNICTCHPYCLMCLLSTSVPVTFTACHVCSQHLHLPPLLR